MTAIAIRTDRHLATMTVGYETPEVGSNAALRAVASHWRVSGILNARSGNRLEILSGIDNAFTGIGNQRPNKVSDDFYAHSLTSYFNRAAFAQPAAGTLGDLPRNAAVGPNFWNVDLAVSKLVAACRHAPAGAPPGVVQSPQPFQLGRPAC